MSREVTTAKGLADSIIDFINAELVAAGKEPLAKTPEEAAKRRSAASVTSDK